MLSKYISVIDYLAGKATLDQLPDEIVRNINTLIPKINDLLEHFGAYRGVNSGYRTSEDQIRIYKQKLGAAYDISKVAMKSAHLVGAAIDLEDKDRKLTHWALINLPLLQQMGLYIEEPASCPTWLHIQCISPKSGKTIFQP